MPLVLGIDVGGTKIALSLGDEAGAIRASERRPTESSGNALDDLDRIAADARALLEKAGLAPAELAGVGVSLPGPLDLEHGLVLTPPNLPGWNRAPVRDRLAEALGVPVFLENDANAAALAEGRFGAGRGAQHVVYLTCSTGMGGGLVLGGRIHQGVAASAGEVGHMPIVWEGERCFCGLDGCLEAYVGGRAWTARLQSVTPAASRVAALAGSPEQARPEHVVEAAREGDAFALAEMARFNDYLARGIVNLTFVLAPEVFVLGTIAVAAGEELCLGPVREKVRSHVWPFLGEELRIVPAELGSRMADYAGLVIALAALA
jgi:glucokinase